mmetsp:Transcript_14523/g.24093  ORF Transcript_14523/g.24093 Transcript_14523/m.24093 type:complete len:285 (+) Transcript_14523:408-1262(+)
MSIYSVGGPEFDSFDVPSVSSYSLSRTLDMLGSEMRNRTTVSVLISSADDVMFTTFRGWTYELFKNRSLFTQIYKCPNGNNPSFQCMMDTVFHHRKEGLIENSDIVYFVEDDYIHKPEATKELIDIFSSHDPCFAVPYDYGDRYYRSDFNDDDGKITLIAGKGRHWRTVHATTVTYSARFETMEYFHNKDMLPYPPDDYFRSLSISKAGAPIVSPLPSLATHLEYYGKYLDKPTAFSDSHEYVSLYYDWYDEAAYLLQQIHGMKWNLWSLHSYYSRKSTDVFNY